MSKDIKPSRGQLSKIIKSGIFLGTLLGKITGTLMTVAVSSAKIVLAVVVTIASFSEIDCTIQRRMDGTGAIATSRVDVIKAWKRIILSICNEDIDDIITIIGKIWCINWCS